MSKLSQTEFAVLLDLVTKTDLEQRMDLQEFLQMEPKGQLFVLKLINQAKVTKSIRAGHDFYETPTHDKEGKKKSKRGGRVAKPLTILAPSGCKMDEEISFNLDRFEGWLKQKGFKSSRTYVAGIKGMLKSLGMAYISAITVFGLKSLRDSVTDNTKLDQNKRTWLKKFNEYVVYEYNKTTQSV